MSKLLTLLEGRRANLLTERDGILDNATPETFTAEVEARTAAIDDEIRGLDDKIEEARADLATRALQATGATTVTVTSEPNPVYRKDDPTGHSFFRDLFSSTRGDVDARQRLVDSQVRALSTTAGAGGQFAPPLWLVEDFVAYARPGRVTADLMQKDALPEGVSSINLPTVATGTATAVQATQNSAVQSTDLTTSSVSSGITTIAGQQTVAMQLLAQSGIPFDRVILADLARAYAAALDVQVINGSGSSGQLTGIVNTASINAQTYTQASPAVVGAGQFYSQVVQAINLVNTNRFLPPTAIVMHPRRWAWVLNALDTANRPLVVPNGPAFNQLATGNEAAQGAAGTLLGVPVYVDPNIPTNLGAGTNQDPVIVMRADDLWLYESALQTASFDATYANQASILFRVLGYSAFIPNRYPKSIAVINGTGLVTPTF